MNEDYFKKRNANWNACMKQDIAKYKELLKDKDDKWPSREEILEAILDAKLSIGQKVIYDGEEDEVEGFCPLHGFVRQDNGELNVTYLGLGYNLKFARKTVLFDDLKIISK